MRYCLTVSVKKDTILPSFDPSETEYREIHEEQFGEPAAERLWLSFQMSLLCFGYSIEHELE